jgi:uncharacterized protein YciI
VSTFVLRLLPPRPSFALDMTDVERDVMERHAAHWQPWVDDGRMVVFGPVLDGTGGWGLAVVQTGRDTGDGVDPGADQAAEQEFRAFAATDPAIASGTVQAEIGTMMGGFVR